MRIRISFAFEFEFLLPVASLPPHTPVHRCQLAAVGLQPPTRRATVTNGQLRAIHPAQAADLDEVDSRR